MHDYEICPTCQGRGSLIVRNPHALDGWAPDTCFSCSGVGSVPVMPAKFDSDVLSKQLEITMQLDINADILKLLTGMADGPIRLGQPTEDEIKAKVQKIWDRFVPS